MEDNVLWRGLQQENSKDDKIKIIQNNLITNFTNFISTLKTAMTTCSPSKNLVHMVEQ